MAIPVMKGAILTGNSDVRARSEKSEKANNQIVM